MKIKKPLEYYIFPLVRIYFRNDNYRHSVIFLTWIISLYLYGQNFFKTKFIIKKENIKSKYFKESCSWKDDGSIEFFIALNSFQIAHRLIKENLIMKNFYLYFEDININNAEQVFEKLKYFNGNILNKIKQYDEEI